MVRTTWVYSLRKEELTSYLTEFGLETGGTVEEMRKQFANFILETELEADELIRMAELEAKHSKTTPKGSTSDLTQGTSAEQTKLESKEVSQTNSTSCQTEIPKHVIPGIILTQPGINNDFSADNHGSGNNEQVSQISHPTMPPHMLVTQQRSAAVMTSNLCNTEPSNAQQYPQFHTIPHQDYQITRGRHETYAAVLDKIRKWPIKFDGKSPLLFIERLEELAEVYEVNLDILPRTMPELLKDKALSWYRNNNQRWTSWSRFREDLLRFFLPVRYFEQLEDRVRQRIQQPRETFNDFTLAIQELMRHTKYSEEQKLERVYRNSRQAYQLHIKRREFSSLDELLLLAGDYEAIKHGGHMESIPHTRVPVMQNRKLSQESDTSNNYTARHSIDERVDVRSACRRCGQTGHFYRNCKNQQILFCWTCGRKNIRTLNCCGKQTGNGNGNHEMRGNVLPQQPNPRRQ